MFLIRIANTFQIKVAIEVFSGWQNTFELSYPIVPNYPNINKELHLFEVTKQIHLKSPSSNLLVFLNLCFLFSSNLQSYFFTILKITYEQITFKFLILRKIFTINTSSLIKLFWRIIGQICRRGWHKFSTINKFSFFSFFDVLFFPFFTHWNRKMYAS